MNNDDTSCRFNILSNLSKIIFKGVLRREVAPIQTIKGHYCTSHYFIAQVFKTNTKVNLSKIFQQFNNNSTI